MPNPKLTKLELQVMEALWQKGACSVREIQETFPEAGRPAYTTVQTTVYRLERKKALRCVKRISNANIFEAAISRRRRAAPIDRRIAGAAGRQGQAGDGAPGGVGRADFGRREGSGEGAAEGEEAVILNHLWQSSLFVVAVWALTLVLEDESRGGAVLVVAGGVGEVFDSFFFAGERWGAVWMADGGSGDESASGFFCDGRDWTGFGWLRWRLRLRRRVSILFRC